MAVEEHITPPRSSKCSVGTGAALSGPPLESEKRFPANRVSVLRVPRRFAACGTGSDYLEPPARPYYPLANYPPHKKKLGLAGVAFG
jgi:hypothetical protein